MTLVDHARAATREKRGGKGLAITLADHGGLMTIHPEQFLQIESALHRLAELDPRASRIVELRYFVGLDNEEVAAVLNVSEKTVWRDWRAAKAWLRAELYPHDKGVADDS